MPNLKQKQIINHPTVLLVTALVILMLAVAASRGSDMHDWEITLFYAIYELPRWLLPFFVSVTQLGSVYMLGLLSMFYLLLGRFHILLRLLLTGTLAYAISGIAKDLWGRARPFDYLPDVISLDKNVWGPGFPSGHVALATAIALSVRHYLPHKYRWIPVASIVAVALSRVYLGVHAPLDILGGFAIGWACYALFQHVKLYDIRHGRHNRIAHEQAKS